MGGAVAALGRGWTDSYSALWRAYSWLPITRTLADFLHTVTVILPSVMRTLDDSNLPLTRNYFCLALYWLIILRWLLSPCSKYQHISWWSWSDRAWYLYCSPIRISFLFSVLVSCFETRTVFYFPWRFDRVIGSRLYLFFQVKQG